MKTIIAIIVAVISLVIFIMLKPFEVVDTGYRGIEVRFGKVTGESLGEGLYFYNPLTTNIVEMDTRTQRLEHKEQAYTKDVQQANISYVVNFNLDRTGAHFIYQEVGRDWQEKLVPQVISGTLKNVIGKWDAVDLVANRDKASIAIETAIREALGLQRVTVTKFEITDMDYNDEFEKAVENKVTAIQNAIAEQNRTVQIQEQANQKVISAKAEAESMRIRADALTQNKALVDYEAVMKWDGHLPQYMLGGAMPLLNMGQKQ